MNQDTVTVVTVTYNCKDLLEDTILSVINQTYKNIEYIIIDGGSTDGTLDIVKKYEKYIDYWVSEPDDGIYFAMNKAIEKATGEWINFMNAGDSFFDLNTVEYVMKHKSCNAELIYGNYKIKDTGQFKKALDKSKWFQGMPFCHQTLFTKITVMKDELFNTSFNLAADHNFLIKMYKKDKIFCYIDRIIAVFDIGGFADSNKLLMYVESIKVLVDNGIDFSEIKQSFWYNSLHTESPIYQEKIAHINRQSKWIKKQEKIIEEKNSHINQQSKWIKKQEKVIEEIKILSRISLLFNPIKKIKQYKKFMRTFMQ